jgi:outer membrane immunogenic protein
MFVNIRTMFVNIWSGVFSMKRFLATASFIVFSSGAVLAADLPMKAAPYFAPPAYSWTGFYLGGVGTVGMMGSEHADQWCDMTCSTPVERRWGGGIGGTAGYNWQAGHVLYGIEGDVSWVSFKTNHQLAPELDGDSGLTIGATWNWYSTIRGRMGLVVDDTLAYVTGGVAFVGANYHSYYFTSAGAFDGGFPSVNSTRVGLAAGFGVEHKFTPNWSLKAEYLYIGLESAVSSPYISCVTCTTTQTQDVMTHRSDAHLLRVGVNYSFNAAPLVARY